MHMRYLVIFIFLALGRPQSVQAQFLNESTQLKANRVKEIRVFGNQFVDQSVVLSRLTFTVDKSYHPAILRDKVSESIEKLHKSGLFSDINVEVEYPDATSDVIFIFNITERPTLGRYEVSGNDEIMTEDIEDRIRLVEGQVFGQADLERNRQRIIQQYKDDGFLLVEVYLDKIVNPETGRTDVTFRIVEGQKVTVEEIKIEGNTLVNAEEIIKHLESSVDHWYAAGEYKEEAWESDQDSIVNTYHRFGYLDAEVLEYRNEYLPDTSYRFYGGDITQGDIELGTLLKSVNEDILKEGSALARLYDQNQSTNNLYKRRFGAKGKTPQSTRVKPFGNEEELVLFLNRLIEQEELRSLAIDILVEDRTFKNAKLTKLLSQTKRSPIDDRLALRLILEENYPLARFSESIHSSKVRLYSKIHEGRKYYAGRFTFLENKVLTDPVLNSQVNLVEGETFNEAKYQEMVQRVYGLYREDGYLFVRIDEQKTYRDSLVDVTFVITEGLPASVRKVIITDNTTTKDKVIRREIKLFPGDTYRQSLMERSFRDIMQLNYFDGVEPDVKVVGEQEVDLVWSVAEREAGTGQFTAGMAFSARDGLVGTLGLSIPNCCLGDGQRADLNIEYGANRENYSIGFSEPWFMDTPTSLGARANYSKYKLTGREDVMRRGVSTFLGRRLTWPDDYFYVQSDLSFQENVQGDNNRGIIQKTGYETSAGITLIRDDKNLPQFPTEGSRYKASVTYAFPIVESTDYRKQDNFNFIKTETEIKWWFPIVGGLALGLENHLGIIAGPSIQYFSLYQMGGMLGYQGKMRGYDPGAIGLSRIGRTYSSFTSQLTYPVAENRFYLQAFFDAGMVYGQSFSESSDIPEEKDLPKPWEEIDLNQMVRDVGFGFRVIVPMLGIIGFDFGWPLDMDKLNQIEGTNYSDEYRLNFVIEQGF